MYALSEDSPYTGGRLLGTLHPYCDGFPAVSRKGRVPCPTDVGQGGYKNNLGISRYSPRSCFHKQP